MESLLLGVALKLTSYLFSAGWKMYKSYKMKSKSTGTFKTNIGVDVEDDVDDDRCEADSELMTTGANLTLQLKTSLESTGQPRSKVIR